MEGAAGGAIPYILEDYLQSPYNLKTLRAEDRSLLNPKRSLLYKVDDKEAPSNDLSWKVLGGGMESSAYDLARFGVQVMDGTILTEASRNQLWTAPNTWGCGGGAYALGWCVGTKDGTQVVSKVGRQNGANSYIRMYPDEEIVIVVLTNRRGGGHKTWTIGQDIGALMLAERNAAVSIAGSQQALDLAQEEIDEPDSEGLPAEYVVWPVSNPVAELTPEDIGEPVPEGHTLSHFLYLPLSIH
jgi:CubicO group peptidase (beta-lactamase class C family)